MSLQHKNIDKLIKKAVIEEGLEYPSASFLDNVMHAIDKEKALLQYTPLIPKKAWWGIALACIAVIVLGVNTTTGNAFLSDFEVYNKITTVLQDFNISGLQISKLVTYILTVALVMVLVQLFVVKRLFDKQLYSE